MADLPGHAQAWPQGACPPALVTYEDDSVRPGRRVRWRYNLFGEAFPTLFGLRVVAFDRRKLALPPAENGYVVNSRIEDHESDDY